MSRPEVKVKLGRAAEAVVFPGGEYLEAPGHVAGGIPMGQRHLGYARGAGCRQIVGSPDGYDGIQE